MDNIDEIIQAIAIGLAVAMFLINTGHAIKAIELCKESLVLVSAIAMRIEKQFGKFIYKRIYNTMFNAYCRIHDNTNAITYGSKLLNMFREHGVTVNEGRLSIALANIYWSQSMLRRKNLMREQSLS